MNEKLFIGLSMKRFIIVSMSLMCLVPALAQEEFESLLSESKVWTMMIKPSVNPEEYGDLCYIHETKLMGDTIINNIHFMRKYERQCKQGEEMPAAWSATNEYLGQDGSKIYMYSSWSKKTILDMDLSLKVGDKIGYYDLMDKDDDPDVLFYFVVTAVSDTIIGGSTDQKSRRCVYVQVKGIPSLTDVWIEGIGSMQKGITGVWLTMAAGGFEQMMKCTDGDAVLYQLDNSQGETGIEEVKDSVPSIDSPYYTLDGIRVTNQPKRGIYIHDGKKRLAQ